MNKLRFSLLMSFVFISGCISPMKGQFDCPGMPGVRCKSISKVNQMVDIGVIPENQSLDKNIYINQERLVQRTKEEVLTVWVAPFEDEKGIYHEPGRLTAVVSPSKWEKTKA